MKILITGASGFIGTTLIHHLVTEKPDYNIFGAVRKTSYITKLEELGVKLENFDLNDYTTFKRAVQDKDVVVHLAANFNFLASEESLFKENVEATKKLAETCLSLNTNHFIYCSSTEALGVVIDGTEESEYHPDEVYGKSKMEAEKILLQMYHENNFPVTIVRPSGVFGPGENYVFKEIIDSIDRTILNKFIPTKAMNNVQFTYVDDVVRGLIRIIQNPKITKGQIYHLVSDNPQSYRQIFCTIADKIGRRRPIFIPYFPLIFIKPFWPLIVKFYRKKGFGYPYVPNGLYKLQTNRNYLNLKAKRDIGFHPKVTFEEGVERTINWMRSQNMIKTKRK
ncbi:NAD-dependent epimerase/dehydratase family protein [Candidatus Hodarchaeum mangrovi]